MLEPGGAEKSAWDAARLGLLADVEGFLQRYPSGRFAKEARDRVAALRLQATMAAAAPTTLPTAAPADPGKISLQTLSALTKPAPSTPVPPSPAQASGNSAGQVWSYVVSSAGGKDQTEQIRVLDITNGWQRLSNGSEIHVDGRVRAVRFGSYMVKAVSDDSFMRLPAKPGQSGANTALVTDAQGRGVNARVIWRTEAAGDSVKLVASVDGVSFVLRYEAYFAANQLLPQRYESEMKNRFAGGATQTMTARLQQ